MGPGEVNSILGCKPHCRLKIYDIQGMHYPGQVPVWLKAMGPKADQLWAALEGVDPALLCELFECANKGDYLYAMVPDLSRY